MKNCKLMVFLILSVWCSWINATLDTIIIDQGQDDPVKVAVVPFKDTKSSAALTIRNPKYFTNFLGDVAT